MNPSEITATEINHVGPLLKHIREYLELYEKKRKIMGDKPFSMELMDQRLVITLLLASYLEALINLYLSLKMSADQYGIIERQSVLEKWIVVPSLVLPKYPVDRSGEAYAGLKALLQRRNQIAHLHSDVYEGDELIRKGKPLTFGDEDHGSMMKWLRLPAQLVTQLGAHDKSQEFELLLRKSHLSSLEKAMEIA